MAEFISTMKLEVIDPDTGVVTGSREIDLRNGIVLSAAPTASTTGRVGMSAYVVSGGAITAEFVCTSASGGVYTWVKKATASGGGEDSVFMAEYETTPYDEIRAAHNSGKIVILRRGNLQYVLAAAPSGYVIFTNVQGVTVSKITVSSDDVWVESSSTINTGSGGSGEDSIFIAVYNSTQYSEIREAYDAGKIVFLRYNTSICNLFKAKEGEFAFVRSIEDTNMVAYARQDESGDTQWTYRETELQHVAYMTTTISDTPSNLKYPSEKAVYDFVNSHTGGGGGSIFVAEYGVTPYSDMRSAYDAGKHIILKKDTHTYTVATVKPSSINFQNVQGVNLRRVTASEGDIWTGDEYTVETTGNRVQYISDTPSNDKYPSEKAVYDFVESQTSSGKADSIFYGKKASFYGDSLTEENQNYTKGYHKWVQEILGLKLYNNYGKSGDETYNIIDKVNSITDDANIIFVMIGVNDMRNADALGTFEGLEDGTVYGNLNTICVKLREKYPLTPIVFITPAEQTLFASKAGMTMYDVAKAVREVCVKNAVVYYDNYTISGISRISVKNIRYWTTDGCHWNDKAHEMVGKNLAHFVKDTFHYLADSEESESSTFEGKTLTMQGYASGRFHFTAIVPVDEDFAAGNKVRISLQGTDGVNVKTNDTTNLEIYGDTTGICSNNTWEGQYSGKVANNLTVDSNGNISAENEYTLNAAPTTTNIKVIIAVGIEDEKANASFVIQSLAVTVNGKEKEILNVGGFFVPEKYTITDTEAL